MNYVILSVLMYVCSFLFTSTYPGLCCIAISLFVVPLCMQPSQTGWKQRFWHGWVWGLIVSSIHASWVLDLIVQKNLSLLAVVLWVLLIGWYSFWAGLWLCCFVYARVCSTVLFFMFLTNYSSFWTGHLEGYPLYNPFIIFAAYPELLRPVHSLSTLGALIILFGIQVSLFDLLVTRSRGSLVIIAVYLSLVLYGYGHKVERIIPCVHSMTTIRPWWYGCKDPMFAGYRMSHDLYERVKQHPEKSSIVMPESTYCWDLADYQSFIAIWSDSAQGRPVLFGAHVTQSGVSHNAAFLLHNNELVFCYRKRHFTPFMEQSIWFERLCNHSIVYGPSLISPVVTDDDDLITLDGVTYQIFICSELFFEAKRVKGYPVILLWNDSWIGLNWVNILAERFILYFQEKYQVCVVHVSTQGRTNIL